MHDPYGQPGHRPQYQPQRTSKGGGNPNPVSTLGFLWNMGYPPPPITHDGLKKLAETCIDNQTFTIPERALQTLLDEVKRQPFSRSQTILFVVQQSLHSSKLEKVSNALELAHIFVTDMKLEFARHINREFMTSIKNVISTTSYKDRTIGGSLKKFEKWMAGNSQGGIATDPKVQTLQRRALQCLRIWVDLTIGHEIDCSAIHEMYRKLSSRGYQFPGEDVVLPAMASFMSAATGQTSSYGYQTQPLTPAMPLGPPGGGYPSARQPQPSYGGEYNRADSATISKPIDNVQVGKLLKALEMYNAPETSQAARERCVNVFKKMEPRVVTRITKDSDAPASRWNPTAEDQMATLLDLKDRMDRAIREYDQNMEPDEFADLGLDGPAPRGDVPPPPPPPRQMDGKGLGAFSEPLTSRTSSGPQTTYGNSTYDEPPVSHYLRSDSFASAASSVSGDLAQSPESIQPAPAPKPVDPFAALDDVWDEEQ